MVIAVTELIDKPNYFVYVLRKTCMFNKSCLLYFDPHFIKSSVQKEHGCGEIQVIGLSTLSTAFSCNIMLC